MHLKQYVIDLTHCTHCQRCFAVCPTGAIKITASGAPQIENQQECKRCGACKKICSHKAISYRVRLQF
ncbi:4Fe-4S binding protein [bacterium BFN5]|nr:4Fe-4S binding protein [bacterium BFN5]